MTCPLCQCEATIPIYQGPIRKGKWPNRINTTVHHCRDCTLSWLPEELRAAVNYEDGSYRELLSEPLSGREHALSQDPRRLEQLFRATDVRYANVIDIGAGDCAYADMVQSRANTYAVVEPGRHFRDRLIRYAWYFSVQKAIESGNKYDLAVMWDVIEHVDDPLQFINDCKALLEPGGKIVGCTPNMYNCLWLAECKTYLEWFYRLQHPWYFTPISIRRLAEKANLTVTRIWLEQRMTEEEFALLFPEGSPYRKILGHEAFQNVRNAGTQDTLFFEFAYNGHLH